MRPPSLKILLHPKGQSSPKISKGHEKNLEKRAKQEIHRRTLEAKSRQTLKIAIRGPQIKKIGKDTVREKSEQITHLKREESKKVEHKIEPGLFTSYENTKKRLESLSDDFKTEPLSKEEYNDFKQIYETTKESFKPTN